MGGSYPSAEVQSVYSTALADWAILCPGMAVVGKFLLVDQYWHNHVKGSVEERCLWDRPCFSSSIPHVLFVLIGWFYGWEVSGHPVVTSWGVASGFFFNIVRSFLVPFPSSFFFMCFVSVYMVHPCNSTGTTAVWKKSRFTLWDKSDNLTIHSLSIAIHTFAYWHHLH